MKKYTLAALTIGAFLLYAVLLNYRHALVSVFHGGRGGQSLASAQPAPGQTSATGAQAPQQPTAVSGAQFKDGAYTGNSVNVFFGNVQVSAVISGGKLSAVHFLQYPNTHSVSVFINQQAMPYLKSEAIQAQSANVNIISGATLTSEGFQASLASALNQAKN
jgi:uncharacterized protein with FMN-binding domain